MQKFIYFLTEASGYPNEIYANSKQEVVKLLSESVDQSSIENIFTEEEFLKRTGQYVAPSPQQNVEQEIVNQDSIERMNYDGGADFMNDMMKKATSKAISMNKTNNTTAQVVVSEPAIEVSPQNAKYFEDHGIKFKVENGKIFKKVWTDISSADDAEYRIVRKSNHKVVSKDSFILEKLDWEELS